MSRKETLLRLHAKLKEKRDELRRTLSLEMEFGQRPRDVGDSGDDAVDDNEKELNSQLVAFESRELAQIERALEAIQNGRYGTCELCRKSIPIPRLRALPFTPFCVECQQKVEESGGNLDELGVNWESACEFEGRLSDVDVSLADYQFED